MSVLIKGMKIPTSCLSCDFCNPFADEPYCRRLMRRIPKDTRLEDCPIVEIPAPHGHLIDGEVLWDQLRYGHDVDLSELPETLAAFKKAEENPRCGTGEGGEVRPYRA